MSQCGANDPQKYPVGDVNDIHDYPNPRVVTPTATKYAMIGEFGGIGAFLKGKEWVPGKCHTYLKVDTPTAEAMTYVNMTKTLLHNAQTWHDIGPTDYAKLKGTYMFIENPTRSR